MTGAATRPFLVSAFLFAAASSAQTLEFEVAAIKPAADCVLGPNGGGKLGRTSPGRIEVECCSRFRPRWMVSRRSRS